MIGSYVANGDTLVFLASGGDCVGALAKSVIQGGQVIGGAVTLTLPEPALYQACHSSSPLPSSDAMFQHLSGVALVATESEWHQIAATISTNPAAGIGIIVAIIVGSTVCGIMLVARCYLACYRCHREGPAELPCLPSEGLPLFEVPGLKIDDQPETAKVVRIEKKSSTQDR